MAHRGASRILFAIAIVMLILFFLFQLFSLGQMIIQFLFQSFFLFSLEDSVRVVYFFFGLCLSGLLSYYWLMWLAYDSFRDVDLVYTGAIWIVYGLGIVISLLGSRTPISIIMSPIIMSPGLLVIAAGLFIRESGKSVK